jgi:hypothetical protein
MGAVHAGTHSEHGNVIRFDFNPGSVEKSIHHWGHCEAFKHEALIFLSLISLIYSLFYIQIKVLVDAVFHSENVKSNQVRN